MAALTRVFQKIFATNAPSTQLAKFGSLASGTPVTTNDPATIQSLSQFTDGWFSAILGVNSPAIHDMNSLFFLLFRQMAYIFEKGVAEWNAETTYYIGSIVNSTGDLYISITNNNLNNPVSDSANWNILSGAGVRMTLCGGVTPWVTIDGYHRARGNRTLRIVDISLGLVTRAGDVVIGINVNGVQATTATLSAVVGTVSSTEVTLGSPVSISSGDLVSIDIVSTAAIGEDLTVELIGI